MNAGQIITERMRDQRYKDLWRLVHEIWQDQYSANWYAINRALREYNV